MISKLLQYAFALALAGVGYWAVGEFGPEVVEWAKSHEYVIEAPQFLWVLGLIPLLIIIRAHTLSDLPKVQQGLSIIVRSALIIAIVGALIDVQKIEKEPKTTSTVYVVDVSESVPDKVLERTREEMQKAWDKKAANEIRLVVFAGEAKEIPLPVGQPKLPKIPRLPRPKADTPKAETAAKKVDEKKTEEGDKKAEDGDKKPEDGDKKADEEPQAPAAAASAARFDADPNKATDIQKGLRLAFSLFPDDALKRLVLVTDGLETQGTVQSELATAKRFDVPVHYLDFTNIPRPGEMMVMGVEVPDNIKARIPFKVKSSVKATQTMEAKCELRLDGLVEEVQEVVLKTGDNPIEFETKVKEGGDKKVAVSCKADRKELDRFASNNIFEVPIKVPDRPKLLYIEGEKRYRRNLLAALNRDFKVELRGARGVPSSMSDAKQYDLIFISDVPRQGRMRYANMTTKQMKVLHKYSRSGGGLIFAGGENSFGPGGYTGTYLERKVLPVRLDVQKKEDIVGLALMLVIDRSGSMSGPKIELAKEAARATMEVLQPSDKLGVIAFDSQPIPIVRLQRASNRLKITDSLRRLRSGGGTDIFPALDQAYQQLSAVQAKRKHIILLTDGQSNRSGILELVQQSLEDKITISSVAVGRGSDSSLLMKIAELGGGRYYFTDRPDNIPKLFLKETSEVMRRALVEDRFRPRTAKRFRRLQMFKGIDVRKVPPLLGYVSTRAKRRAEVLMTSHLREPILARWRLGMGKVVVWTSDVKNRWAHYWLKWGGYAKFWRQIIRDTMRVEKEDPKFEMVADIADGVLSVGVDAVDDEDKFIDGLDSDVTVIDPTGKERPLELVQTAAGRYEGKLEVDHFGPYTIKGTHTPKAAPDKRHVSYAALAWPFPSEHLVGDPDLTPVEELAAATGGVKAPKIEALFDPGDAKKEKRVRMWAFPLYFALGLLLLDLLLRRIRFYGRTSIRWDEVRG